MAIKVLKMITGEQVIADVDDLIDSNGNKIGFELCFPYTLVMRQTSKSDEPLKFDVNYLAWMSASSDSRFAVPYSSVVTFGEVAKEIVEEYEKQFGELLREIRS